MLGKLVQLDVVSTNTPRPVFKALKRKGGGEIHAYGIWME